MVVLSARVFGTGTNTKGYVFLGKKSIGQYKLRILMSRVETLSFKDVHDVEWQQEALPKVEGHVGGQLGTGPNIIMTELIAYSYLSAAVY
jgi:hypothetical protein